MLLREIQDPNQPSNDEPIEPSDEMLDPLDTPTHTHDSAITKYATKYKDLKQALENHYKMSRSSSSHRSWRESTLRKQIESAIRKTLKLYNEKLEDAQKTGLISDSGIHIPPKIHAGGSVYIDNPYLMRNGAKQYAGPFNGGVAWTLRRGKVAKGRLTIINNILISLGIEPFTQVFSSVYINADATKFNVAAIGAKGKLVYHKDYYYGKDDDFLYINGTKHVMSVFHKLPKADKEKLLSVLK